MQPHGHFKNVCYFLLTNNGQVEMHAAKQVTILYCEAFRLQFAEASPEKAD